LKMERNPSISTPTTQYAKDFSTQLLTLMVVEMME